MSLLLDPVPTRRKRRKRPCRAGVHNGSKVQPESGKNARIVAVTAGGLPRGKETENFNAAAVAKGDDTGSTSVRSIAAAASSSSSTAPSVSKEAALLGGYEDHFTSKPAPEDTQENATVSRAERHSSKGQSMAIGESWQNDGICRRERRLGRRGVWQDPRAAREHVVPCAPEYPCNFSSPETPFRPRPFDLAQPDYFLEKALIKRRRRVGEDHREVRRPGKRRQKRRRREMRKKRDFLVKGISDKGGGVDKDK